MMNIIIIKSHKLVDSFCFRDDNIGNTTQNMVCCLFQLYKQVNYCI